MRATGIIRKVDGLGRVVIPKELRDILHLRNNDPLEIITGTNDELILKKYSPLGELGELADGIAEMLNKATGCAAAVCSREQVIAVSGGSRPGLADAAVSPQLDKIMEGREMYRYQQDDNPVPLTAAGKNHRVGVAAPVISAGSAIGCVAILTDGDRQSGEVEYKLTQAAADFLGKQTEV